MRLASFGDGRIGVVVDQEWIADVTSVLPGPAGSWPPLDMVRLIAEFPTLRPVIEEGLERFPRHRLADVRLHTPISWPNKLLAFPTNYQAHIDEMKSANRANVNGFFLKANSSLSGPQDDLVLPDLPGYVVHHECELAVIIGRGGRNIPESEAMDHVFGYSCLIDATVRGKQERVMRKSYDTFTPMGPWITTADEVADPDHLQLALWVNDELRQDASTSDLIVGLREMVALSSSVATLMPGDIIASGTPAGVGPIQAGDTIRIAIQDVGQMTVRVVQGSGGSNVAFAPPQD
jgi:2-keto-4-pentenoate hydratase/2-oxohepta-3-ene-1,7-dioic acid hydratase in catechol pathway